LTLQRKNGEKKPLYPKNADVLSQIHIKSPTFVCGCVVVCYAVELPDHKTGKPPNRKTVKLQKTGT